MMVRIVAGLVLALALVVPFAGGEAEAKRSYGPCVDYIFWQWRESRGELGIDWMARKMWANCDPADGGWLYGGD